MNVIDITAEKKPDTIQRLAAYCRVSSDSEDQLHSFAAQLKYYSDYDKSHPEVKLVDIYADEGLSGTSMKKRDEMNRMTSDCQKGKIDKIIVKSVSRFARNTEDLLNTLRLLKSLGVTVFFEEQGIDTSKLNSELFITFPGMIAQQESESISGNRRWSIQKRMESGEYVGSKPPYGFDLHDGNLVINEKEANTVRRIFYLYLQGYGKEHIADILNKEGIPKKCGSGLWRQTTILYILNNERYYGDAILQKTYMTDTLPYREKINKGEKTKYYVENANPPIITKEVFESVRRLQKEREGQGKYQRKKHCLTQKVFCPICNRAYRRLKANGIQYWESTRKKSEPCQCIRFRMKESDLHTAFSILSFKLTDQREALIEYLIKQLTRIDNLCSDNQDRIHEIDIDLAQLSAQNHVITKLHNKGILTASEFTEQSYEIENAIAELRIKRRMLLHENHNDDTLGELSDLNRLLIDYNPSAEFDNVLFRQAVKRVEVIDQMTVRFVLLGNIRFIETIAKKGSATV